MKTERRYFGYTVTYTCTGLVYGETEKEALGNIYRNQGRILSECDEPTVELAEHYGKVNEDEYKPIG